jgi:tripartite-type tricarboxylate transporter receptor subunit TctC
MGFADISAARGALNGGKVRALAVAGPKRLAALPDVPTFAELGYPDFEVYFWQGIAVPAGTPPEIVSKLSTELFKTMNTPDVQKRLMDVGMEVLPTTSEQMAQLIRKDQQFWVPLIKKLGISVD